MDIKEILTLIILVISGGVSFYFKYNKKLSDKAGSLIITAENEYKSVTQSGGDKHEFVVDTIYNLVPTIFKGIFTRTFIGNIVDEAFQKAEAYAKTQADKIVYKAINDGTVTK